MSKILVGVSNGLYKNGTYYPSGFMEQFIEELKNAGNDILVYVPNRFQSQIFFGNNDLLENIDTDKLDEDIKKFNPDLVITFNNTIYNKVLKLTDCPIVVWGADTEPLWNSVELIKKNVERYFFFCFSEQEIAPRKKYFNISDDRIFLMKPATNIKNTHSEKDKNISFIGTAFDSNPYWLDLIEKHRGKSDLRLLYHNFSTYFLEKNNVTEGIADADLLKDFANISETEYISFFSAEKRTQTLMNISDLGLHLWGNKDWERTKTILPSLYACFHKDTVITVEENQSVYNTSKINININHDQSVNGMNFRICDVLASGGCLISSYSPFVREQFKEIPIPMFNDSFEARNLCKDFLENKGKREDLVALSNEIIDKEWRWKHRFKEMEQITGVSLFSDSAGSFSILQPVFLKESDSKSVTESFSIPQKKKLSLKNKLRYKLWKHLNKILAKKGIIGSSLSNNQSIVPVSMEKSTDETSLESSVCNNATFSYKKFMGLRLHEQTVKTLILGSSHGYYGYRADEKLDEFNGAETSQDLYYSYEIYKQFSDAPKLKNVVLFYSVFSPGNILELTAEKWRCDFYRLFYGIPYRFTPEKAKENVMKSLAGFILSEQEKAPVDTHYTGNCDYSFFLTGFDINERVKNHLKGNRRRQNQTEFVRKSILLAKEKGHNLYIVIPPHRFDYTNLLPPFEELFPDLLAIKDDVNILSFLRDPRFQDSDFGDMDHLNQTGAEKLTVFIRDALCQNKSPHT